MKSDMSTCQACGGSFRKKLVEDEVGCRHTYVMTCSRCSKESGGEWVEEHPLLQASRPPKGRFEICQKSRPFTDL